MYRNLAFRGLGANFRMLLRNAVRMFGVISSSKFAGMNRPTNNYHPLAGFVDQSGRPPDENILTLEITHRHKR